MRKIDGVSIQVFLSDGRKLEVKPDGHLGTLMDSRLILTVAVPPERDIHAFTTQGRDQVMPKRNEVPGILRATKGKLFRLQIPLVNHEHEGFLHTSPPSNALRLAELLPGGAVRLWEVCVISQRGEFFLAAEPEDPVACYRNGASVACPALAGRPAILSFVRSLWTDLAELPPLPPPAATVPAPEELPPGTGRVLWWSPSNGMGRVLTPQGIAGVHWTNVAPRGRRAYLVRNELVRFTTIRPPPTTGREKNYTLEITGVTPVSA